MATLAKPQPTPKPFRHDYYATAGILKAEIKQPLKKEVEREVLQLPDEGGYNFEPAQPFRLEGIVAYESGYAQVAGFPSPGGFTTLATSVVEGLNILEVITADRVVGQISTEHPKPKPQQSKKDLVPSVSFLGTRFDNLRINGHKVEVTRCLDIFGPKPGGDKSYFEDEVVLWRISQQYNGLSAWAKERWSNPGIQHIRAPGESTVHCSLVRKVEGAPGISFGHVIDLPHFGKIFLAELRVNRKKAKDNSSEWHKYSFQLTMIKVKLGSMAEGEIDVAPLDTNGGGKGSPPPPPPSPPSGD